MATVVLPVVGVWAIGLFLIILITVVKANNRRLAQTDNITDEADRIKL